jgi:hypothetical protein
MDNRMTNATKPDQSTRDRLLYKYAHVGCPAAHMEDNCAHPDRCADNGRCLDLAPLSETQNQA